MNPSFAHAKIDAAIRFVFGLLVMLIGFALARGPLALIGVVAAVAGVVSAARQFSRLAWLVNREQQIGRFGGGGHPFERGFGGGAGAFSDERSWRRASLPRRIFWLLFTVAEVDGESGAREIDLVRRFLLERFLAPDVLHDLATWNAPRFPGDRLDMLVGSIRSELTEAECESVFAWSCTIALIDDRFTDSEHELLQSIARSLGVHPLRAQGLFRSAKANVLNARAGGGGYAGAGGFGGGFGGPGGGSGAGNRSARSGATWRRREALEVLGLPDDADDTAIRKRHRELVKRYHPDAHASLGDVAAKEASERFKEVQAAYEYLTKT